MIETETRRNGVGQFNSADQHKTRDQLLKELKNLRDRLARQERDSLAARLSHRAVEAMPQGVVITDPSRPDNPIIYCNPGFEQLTGFSPEEILQHNCRFLQGPDTDPAGLDAIRQAVREERGCSIVLVNHRKDGSPFWNALTVSPIRDADGRVTHFVGVQTDISAVKRLEEQYRQSQKMEVVGQLAGGVAHDFNNLLTIIQGYSEMVLRELPAGDPSRELVEGVLHAGERAAGLTRQLLAFSRKQAVQPRVVDLNALVTEAGQMLRRLLGATIELRTVLAPGLPPVKVDPGQMEQVLMNLTVNARDAMLNGGALVMETEEVEGGWVRLSVRDTGAGMDDATLARIFEPFFTTKEKGKGTGLGLATVYGIVEQSGGRIAVSSEAGRGTTFTVSLPATQEKVAAISSSSGPAPSARGKEVVLLVEDDPEVRGLVRRMLRTTGYTVLEAADGEDALRVVQRHAGPINLLLTDVVMPRLSGPQLVERLAPAYPAMKILYFSGYLDDDSRRTLKTNSTLLQKPFSTDVLARVLRDLLDGAPAV